MNSREAETAPMEAILVSGVSGTGKTTVSRLLAERFPRAVAIEADVLSNIFVRSPSLRHAGIDVWKPLMELRQRQVCLLADSYAEANFVPVIDDVVTAEVLEQYRNHLKLRPLLLVTLEAQVAVAFARDAGRERPLQREFLTLGALGRGPSVDHGGCWASSRHLEPHRRRDRRSDPVPPA